MEFVDMMQNPELIVGLQELIKNPDPIVVKRTVKVFTNVYCHYLHLLSSYELKEEAFLKSWLPVSKMVDIILSLVNDCKNQGLLIQLIRFLELAMTSHLMLDLSSFAEVFAQGRKIVRAGLQALKDIITTSYVEPSVYTISIRAIIAITCVRPELLEPVTDLIKRQLVLLPATLFDHNIRSLRKILQRNLFRLLRRAESDSLKSKLIEMMVSVGVPRKATVAWAPSPAERKRTNVHLTEDIVGRITPPQKRHRIEGHEDIERKVMNFLKSQSKALPSIAKKNIVETHQLLNSYHGRTNLFNSNVLQNKNSYDGSNTLPIKTFSNMQSQGNSRICYNFSQQQRDPRVEEKNANNKIENLKENKRKDPRLSHKVLEANNNIQPSKSISNVCMNQEPVNNNKNRSCRNLKVALRSKSMSSGLLPHPTFIYDNQSFVQKFSRQLAENRYGRVQDEDDAQ